MAGGALVNRALLDTDIYSEVLKAVDENVARNAALTGRFTPSSQFPLSP